TSASPLRRCMNEPPNGSRLSCGRSAGGRKAAEPQTKRRASEATQFLPTCERPAASSACKAAHQQMGVLCRSRSLICVPTAAPKWSCLAHRRGVRAKGYERPMFVEGDDRLVSKAGRIGTNPTAALPLHDELLGHERPAPLSRIAECEDEDGSGHLASLFLTLHRANAAPKRNQCANRQN